MSRARRTSAVVSAPLLAAAAVLALTLVVYAAVAARATYLLTVPSIVAVALSILVVAIAVLVPPRVAAAVELVILASGDVLAGLLLRVLWDRGEPIEWAIVAWATTLSLAAAVACCRILLRARETQARQLPVVVLVLASLFAATAAVIGSEGLPN
jgi:hypothetical protein